MSHDDAMALGMFWAGALMVFAPLISAGIVLTVWWRQRARERAGTRREEPEADA